MIVSVVGDTYLKVTRIKLKCINYVARVSLTSWHANQSCVANIYDYIPHFRRRALVRILLTQTTIRISKRVRSFAEIEHFR